MHVQTEMCTKAVHARMSSDWCADAGIQANTADPAWRQLVNNIQDVSASSCSQEQLSSLFRTFQAPHLADNIDVMPDFLLTGRAITVTDHVGSASGCGPL